MILRIAGVPGVLILVAALVGYSFWSGSVKELPRTPPDALALNCESGKTLFIRMDPSGKSAWIIFPDREFRLDRGEDPNRYSNGRTTLIVRGEEMSLEEPGSPPFVNCRRPQA